MIKEEKVSVIVTSRNEASAIGVLIRSIKEQDYKNLEIILVDNNSTDQTCKIAQSQGVMVYNFGPERSAQRNFGVRKSHGKYLLFLDADMELSKDVVGKCVEVLESDKNVGGIIIPEISIGNNFWERVKAFERSFYNSSGDKTTDAARFFSLEAFTKAEGYDETITGPEDWDLSENIQSKGYKIARISSRIYHHERISSIFSLAKKKFYYGLSSHRYLSKHKIPLFNTKTIYFFRPVFYRNWQKILQHPLLACGMILMFIIELFSGGMGYLLGRVRKI